jgi:predicted transcriptional regulator of viral defense system
LISALALYDLTDEIPRKHWIAIAHGTSVKRNKTIKILRLRNLSLGKTQFNLNGVKIPVFDRERTIIDAFRILGLEIDIKALKAALSQPPSKKIDLNLPLLKEKDS